MEDESLKNVKDFLEKIISIPVNIPDLPVLNEQEINEAYIIIKDLVKKILTNDGPCEDEIAGSVAASFIPYVFISRNKNVYFINAWINSLKTGFMLGMTMGPQVSLQDWEKTLAAVHNAENNTENFMNFVYELENKNGDK